MAKLRKIPVIPLILSILIPVFVGATALFTQFFELSCTTATGETKVQMVPSGVKMSTFAPNSEVEISVSAPEPQIARVYDEKQRLTYLAIYLPRAAKRQAYLDRHDFINGAFYAPSKMLKLPDERYLQLDFSEALIAQAKLWMQHHDTAEQGILITTTYQDVAASKVLREDVAAIFELSCRTGSIAVAVWLLALKLALLVAGAIVVIWLIIYAVRRLRRQLSEAVQASAEAQEDADFNDDSDDNLSQ